MLLEFPPTIDGGSLYLLDDDGMLKALAKTSGRIRWQQRVGRPPRLAGGRRRKVHAVVLRGIASERPHRRLTAQATVDRCDRRRCRAAPSPPLLKNGRVFFGSGDGTVYALNAKTGATI